MDTPTVVPYHFSSTNKYFHYHCPLYNTSLAYLYSTFFFVQAYILYNSLWLVPQLFIIVVSPTLIDHFPFYSCYPLSYLFQVSTSNVCIGNHQTTHQGDHHTLKFFSDVVWKGSKDDKIWSVMNTKEGDTLHETFNCQFDALFGEDCYNSGGYLHYVHQG